jgi:hypothetical protein
VANSIGLSIGNGGWLEVSGLPKNRRWLVRVGDHDGHLALDELYACDGITPGALASFPVSEITAWINRADVAGRIRQRLLLPGPDLRRAASYWASGSSRRDANGRGDHWCTEMLLAQYPFEMRETNKPDEPDRVRGRAQAPQTWPEGHVVTGIPRPPMHLEGGERLRRAPADATVSVPARAPYDDAFYRRVAKAYSDLQRDAHGRGLRPRPAQDIAEANDVPLTTVHRWIREARRRGCLAPAAGPGKMS